MGARVLVSFCVSLHFLLPFFEGRPAYLRFVVACPAFCEHIGTDLVGKRDIWISIIEAQI